MNVVIIVGTVGLVQFLEKGMMQMSNNLSCGGKRSFGWVAAFLMNVLSPCTVCQVPYHVTCSSADSIGGEQVEGGVGRACGKNGRGQKCRKGF